MNWVQPLLEWVAAHPWWALGVVFLTAVTDALVVIGLFVPAGFVLFGIGALVALNTVEFIPVLLAAAAGAVAGDGFHYWVGRRYGTALLRTQYAQRYGVAIDRSRRLFERHGFKSILLARFIGLVRPFVPAFAGAQGMGVAWFFTL